MALIDLLPVVREKSYFKFTNASSNFKISDSKLMLYKRIERTRINNKYKQTNIQTNKNNNNNDLEPDYDLKV